MPSQGIPAIKYTKMKSQNYIYVNIVFNLFDLTCMVCKYVYMIDY